MTLSTSRRCLALRNTRAAAFFCGMGIVASASCSQRRHASSVSSLGWPAIASRQRRAAAARRARPSVTAAHPPAPAPATTAAAATATALGLRRRSCRLPQDGHGPLPPPLRAATLGIAQDVLHQPNPNKRHTIAGSNCGQTNALGCFFAVHFYTCTNHAQGLALAPQCSAPPRSPLAALAPAATPTPPRRRCAAAHCWLEGSAEFMGAPRRYARARGRAAKRDGLGSPRRPVAAHSPSASTGSPCRVAPNSRKRPPSRGPDPPQATDGKTHELSSDMYWVAGTFCVVAGAVLYSSAGGQARAISSSSGNATVATTPRNGRASLHRLQVRAGNTPYTYAPV